MNTCKLCNGNFDFRKMQIAEFLGRTEICFDGNLNNSNSKNRFKYCPECGRKLTDNDFGKEIFMCDFKLTEGGKRKVDNFISECRAFRKELLDAGKDTANETMIPNTEDILSDIECWFVDGDEGYHNSWGVTDNYDLDISLYYGEDFIKTEGE